MEESLMLHTALHSDHIVCIEVVGVFLCFVLDYFWSTRRLTASSAALKDCEVGGSEDCQADFKKNILFKWDLFIGEDTSWI